MTDKTLEIFRSITKRYPVTSLEIPENAFIRDKGELEQWKTVPK